MINIIKKENPQWFGKDFEAAVKEACLSIYEAEKEVVDWIFEKGELDFLPKDVVLEFIKERMNKSLKAVGITPVFEVNQKLVEKTDWFDAEVIATKHVDFFYKRSINYNKRSGAVTAKDLF